VRLRSLPEDAAAGLGAEAALRSAALRLFADKGFHGTSIRDIATLAGVSSSLLYHYARSKRDILKQIMREGLSFLIRAARAAIREDAGPEDKLADLVRAHVLVHGYDALRARVVDNEFHCLSGRDRQEILHLRDEYEGLWREVVEQGAATGVFRVDDPGLTTLALLEMCTGVAHWFSPSGRLGVEDIADRFARFALAVVGLSHWPTYPLPPIESPKGIGGRVADAVRP
jgi:AcrR family transcriptional regulator